MKHLLQSFCLLAALAACLGLLIPSAEAADKVSYEVNQVTLKGNTITFQGNFVNKSDNYQRVLGLHIKYRLSDIDAYPLLIGAFDSEDLSVDIGKDPVPFTISVTDNQAGMYTTEDVAVWKIADTVELEEPPSRPCKASGRKQHMQKAGSLAQTSM